MLRSEPETETETALLIMQSICHLLEENVPEQETERKAPQKPPQVEVVIAKKQPHQKNEIVLEIKNWMQVQYR